MIEFQQVFKHYATQDVLRDVSFQINPGERVGIVGPNGAGKSTLFELVTRQADADNGRVIVPNDIRVGYLRQQLNAYQSDDSLRAFTARAIPELDKMHEEIHVLEEQIKDMDADERERALVRLGRLQHDYEDLGGYEMEARADAALSGLGFHTDDFTRPFKAFSGGWQMRAELARNLIARPDVLLLDEPSNYLDLPAVEWMQRYLRDFSGTMLLISHDRFLLESLTNLTLEVSGAQVVRYAGNYAYYIREREGRRHRLSAAKANQDRKREQVERFIERFRAKNTKATQVQSRIKQLAKMESIDVPHEASSYAPIRIPEAPHSGHEMIRLEKAGMTYDGDKWILRMVELQIQRGDRTALVGYNGMGKTTLLRLLAGVREPGEGKRVLGHKVVVGYQSQEFADTMPPNSTVFQIVRKAAKPDVDDKSVRSVLGGFGFGGDAVDKLCKVLSGGEKIRLAFARIFVNPPNLLLLDEPTTHLDIHAREALESALKTYTGSVCLVSHDVSFVRNVATSIIAMTPPGVTRYHGGYDYYREKAMPEAEALTGGGEASKKVERQERKLKKEERRQEMLRLRKVVREAEKEIESLENEQAELTEQLTGDPEKTNFAAVNRRLYEIQIEMTKAMKAWEQGLENLEQL